MRWVLLRLARRLFRNRRRYALAAIFLFLSGFVTFWNVQGNFALPMPMLAGLTYVTVILPLAVVGSIILPFLRQSIEYVSAMLLVQSALGHVWPALSLLDRNRDVQIYWLIGIMICAPLYTGGVLDRFAVARRRALPVRSRSRLDVWTIWNGLVGKPDQEERLAYPGVTRLERLDPAREDRRFYVRIANFAVLREVQIVETSDPPLRYVARWHAETAASDAPGTRGTLTLTLTETPRGTRIERTSAPDIFPLRRWIYAWVDDHFGRELDAQIERLETRDRATSRPDPHPGLPDLRSL
jgi:hypothetical protein